MNRVAVFWLLLLWVCQPACAAPTDDAAWLSGHWKGEGLGGVCDEIWTDPAEGSMSGLFRLVKNGKTDFQEIMVILAQQGTLVLKLKHFKPDLLAMEEKTETVDFPLVRIDKDEIVFDGLTYRKTGENTMEILLELREKNGEIRKEEFRFKRIR